MINKQNIRRKVLNIINCLFALDFFNDPISSPEKQKKKWPALFHRFYIQTPLSLKSFLTYQKKDPCLEQRILDIKKQHRIQYKEEFSQRKVLHKLLSKTHHLLNIYCSNFCKKNSIFKSP